MNKDTLNQDLLGFLAASPTPFHTVKEMQTRLLAAGFIRLDESEAWPLESGNLLPGKYLITRNDSSIIALVIGTESLQDTGIRLVGAHTDSPCLKVKPQPEIRNHTYLQLGVEVYGGVLLNPWYDRDLSLAGRVTLKGKTGVYSRLVDFRRPLAVIPSLAIHLDREVNNQRSINPQKDIPPILLQTEKDLTLRDLLREELGDNTPGGDEILSFELSFYDTQPPALIGAREDFIASARLDNLLSCHAGLTSLMKSDGRVSSLLVCNDHEEVGSASTSGAQGPFLASVLERLISDAGERTRILARSMLISADNAHGIHPNYADRHDANHGPLLNRGPVIKINANQRYATNSVTEGLFRAIAKEAGIECQTFVTRTDMACGSTIGPLTATEIGVPTLDIGLATFGMHSIRELCGSHDPLLLHQVLTRFFNQSSLSTNRFIDQ
ncbi:MAG: M18 family aminopeptidase [Gammaproteobacteria bacterium]|nr:M18 family aminopeptidase [Gammaproteobacteria bacterium]